MCTYPSNPHFAFLDERAINTVGDSLVFHPRCGLSVSLFNGFRSAHRPRYVCFQILCNSGAPARAKRPRSGAPWVRKFGKLSIRENLVMT